MASRVDVLIRVRSASIFALLAMVVVFVGGLQKGYKGDGRTEQTIRNPLYFFHSRATESLLLETLPCDVSFW
jgi:hypothetical protein